MKLYNTLTRKKEEVKGSHKGKIRFFVCGPTVYDHSHIGHARTYLTFDALVRYLRLLGNEVFYLMNITDIDDKIINRARELGVSAAELAAKFEKVFMEDMKALGVRRAVV